MFKRMLTNFLAFLLMLTALFSLSSCSNKIKLKASIKITFLSEAEYLSNNYEEILKTRQKAKDVSNNKVGPDQKIYVVIDLALSNIKKLGEDVEGNLSIALSSDFGSDFDYNVEDFPTSTHSETNNTINVPFKVRDGSNRKRTLRFIFSLKKHTDGDVKISSNFSVPYSFTNTKGKEKYINLNKGENPTASVTVNIDEDLQKESQLQYQLSSDGTYYSVIGLGTETGDKIVIPAKYKDIPVKEIASHAFMDAAHLKNVLLYEGLEKNRQFSL